MVRCREHHVYIVWEVNSSSDAVALGVKALILVNEQSVHR